MSSFLTRSHQFTLQQLLLWHMARVLLRRLYPSHSSRTSQGTKYAPDLMMLTLSMVLNTEHRNRQCAHIGIELHMLESSLQNESHCCYRQYPSPHFALTLVSRNIRLEDFL